MLDAIVAVTLSAPDLAAAERAYESQLGYQTVERGRVTRVLAQGWGAPAMRGRDYVVMQPPSGAPVYLRLVDAEPLHGYAPLQTTGWNANEILVEDPVQLAPRLSAPFEIIGPPRPLAFNPKIVAMQVTGPVGEVNYFTRIPPGASTFDLGTATTFVDRTFIVVVGGRDIHAMRAFYRDVLELPTTDPAPTRVEVIQDAYALPRDAMTLLALAKLPRDFLIELDQYPPGVKDRPRRRGALPPGIAMVSFSVKELPTSGLRWAATPRRQSGLPYEGRRAGVLLGAAGEWIELIEAPAAPPK